MQVFFYIFDGVVQQAHQFSKSRYNEIKTEKKRMTKHPQVYGLIEGSKTVPPITVETTDEQKNGTNSGSFI